MGRGERVMRAGRRRFLFNSLLVCLFLAMQVGGVSAQILDPVQSPDPTPYQAPTPEPSPVPEPTPEPVVEVTPTAEPSPEVINAPQEKTQDPAPTDLANGGTGETTAGNDPGSGSTSESPSLAETVEEAGTALGSQGGIASVGESVAKENPNLVQAIADVVSKVESTIGEAGAPEVVPGDSATAVREGGTTSLSQARTTTAIKTWAERGGGILSSLGGIFGSAQPSFAILVDAMNDADGDGSFSDAEIAPAPNSDVRFRALISNIGSTTFQIAGVNHSYPAAEGRVQVSVCENLVGLVLLAGDSVPCTFSLTEYAPSRGGSMVNTITAAAFEISGPKRGASDSDTSTVDTLLGDEVLAVAVSREPGVLAFTGMDAVGLSVLALTLLASGAALTHLARLRRLRQTPAVITVDPWLELELLRWWDSNGRTPVPQEKISP